jgi:hypothetical protein
MDALSSMEDIKTNKTKSGFEYLDSYDDNAITLE